MRISWRQTECNNYSVVGQQMENDKDQFIVRAWNPLKRMVPLDEDNGNENVSWNPFFCFCCACIDKIFISDHIETIYAFEPGIRTADTILEKIESINFKRKTALEVFTWIVSFFAHIILFSPIIKTMTWIPLVNFLL